MTKESGLGVSVTVDDHTGSGKDISNDVISLEISTPRSIQDITGMDKSAMERLLLLADAHFVLNGAFNPAANLSHDVFKRISTTSVARVVVLVVSSQTLTATLLFEDYALTRAVSGELTWVATGRLANGTAPTWS